VIPEELRKSLTTIHFSLGIIIGELLVVTALLAILVART
jgi:hypothetical protein